MNSYMIKRHIVEFFQVNATDRKSALLEVLENPCRVDVIRETCVKVAPTLPLSESKLAKYAEELTYGNVKNNLNLKQN